MTATLPMTALIKGAVLAFSLVASAQGQETPETPIVPAAAASAPAAATAETKPKCSLSWQSIAGAILGSATDKVAGNTGSKVGIDGLGKPAGDGVQGTIAPGCVRSSTPSVLKR